MYRTIPFLVALPGMLACGAAFAGPDMSADAGGVSLQVAQSQQADEPDMETPDREYDPEERPGGYGESEPATDSDVQVEEMGKQPPTEQDREEQRKAPKGAVEPREGEETEEKPWYRFWE